MLVLDADTGVVNPNHCIEEYIDDRVNLIFYERFFNWEIMSGNYLAVVLESVIPKDSQPFRNCEAIWLRARDYDSYIPFVVCVRIYLGARRIWPGKLRLLPRAHGMARDRYHTNDEWCENDFMIHGWKENEIDQREGYRLPFKAPLNVSKCGADYKGWLWKPEMKISIEAVKEMIRVTEMQYGDALPKKHLQFPFFSQPNVGLCYPNCDDYYWFNDE
ncbi:unnamed protein product [Toxocara canis]|uniref:Glycosyltransferase family 92 protein n=1 Tax=Toxocara canis TaxID=6265 RepID=A0A183UX30_TOXCA|nr:unnamed protein product [Toxocara canis]